MFITLLVSGGGHPIQCLKTAGKGGEEELLPRKYRSEFIVMLDISPLFWFSKKQSAIKTCSVGSEFIWYLVEVVGHDGKKVLWEVVGDHVVE